MRNKAVALNFMHKVVSLEYHAHMLRFPCIKDHWYRSGYMNLSILSIYSSIFSYNAYTHVIHIL